ncbi:MAG: hypothetical protein QM756_45670 [Polyangiaceae bacterium]
MRLLIGLGFCLSCVSCSDPDQPHAPSTSASGGASVGGTSGAGTGGGGVGGSGGAGTGGSVTLCNQLALDGPDYVIAFASGSAPAPKGGSVVDGTYVYSRMITYGLAGSDIVAGRGKVVLSGTKWEAIEDNDASGDADINPSHTFTATFTTSGSEFALTQSCPKPDSLSGSYTAEGDTLTLYVVESGVRFAEVLKRQ